VTFFRVEADGLVLTVRVSPKASRNAVQGVMETPDGFALKVAVTAPPDKGKANAAVLVLLAKVFGVSKSSLSVVAGQADRRKILRIKGDPTVLSPIAQQWMSS
tara:strand:- start:764 stop:1072 length:309 start_codon:yes stop_codon:yes gene_type:complete